MNTTLYGSFTKVSTKKTFTFSISVWELLYTTLTIVSLIGCGILFYAYIYQGEALPLVFKILLAISACVLALTAIVSEKGFQGSFYQTIKWIGLLTAIIAITLIPWVPTVLGA